MVTWAICKFIPKAAFFVETTKRIILEYCQLKLLFKSHTLEVNMMCFCSRNEQGRKALCKWLSRHDNNRSLSFWKWSMCLPRRIECLFSFNTVRMKALKMQYTFCLYFSNLMLSLFHELWRKNKVYRGLCGLPTFMPQ